MRLSKRLALLCDMVQSGSRVCDVGTDHGYLPAFLYKTGKCESICATDIREKPLNRARENLAACKAAGVKLYLCDGLDSISRDMADTVIIAGIGGEVISGIIDRAEFLRDSSVTLILQATTGADRLREYLAQSGFAVAEEKAAEDNGKLFSIMKCRFSGEPYRIDAKRKAVGLITADYPEGRAYIKKQYNIAWKRVQELKNTEKNVPCRDGSEIIAASLKKLLDGEKNDGI